MIEDKNTRLKHTVDFEKKMLNYVDDDNELDDASFVYSRKHEEKLDNIRNLFPLFRIFRPIEDGSLRGGIISWMVMSMGAGVLNYPKIFSSLGFIGSLIVLSFNLYIVKINLDIFIRLI